jgi:hypothetical protein
MMPRRLERHEDRVLRRRRLIIWVDPAEDESAITGMSWVTRCSAMIVDRV